MNLIPQAVRDGFARLLGPLPACLIRMHVRPNVLTTVGTLVVVGSALTFALGKARFFFFQAEDGIRDYKVTGVQTCALPISRSLPPPRGSSMRRPRRRDRSL